MQTTIFSRWPRQDPRLGQIAFSGISGLFFFFSTPTPRSVSFFQSSLTMAAKFPDAVHFDHSDGDRPLTGSVCPINVSLGAVVGTVLPPNPLRIPLLPSFHPSGGIHLASVAHHTCYCSIAF